jgi:hypothetical protein
VDELVERLLMTGLSDRFGLRLHGHERSFGRIGVDVPSTVAPLVALDAPREEVDALVYASDPGLLRRQRDSERTDHPFGLGDQRPSVPPVPMNADDKVVGVAG